jgi:hypothetical protein
MKPNYLYLPALSDFNSAGAWAGEYL